MTTDLYIISNIKTSKKEVIQNKALYLNKLKDLNLKHIYVPAKNNIKLNKQ